MRGTLKLVLPVLNLRDWSWGLHVHTSHVVRAHGSHHPGSILKSGDAELERQCGVIRSSGIPPSLDKEAIAGPL